MIRLKNIKKSPGCVSYDAFVEDCRVPLRITVFPDGSFETGERPKGYEWCDSHIAHAVFYPEELFEAEKIPAERLIMWYSSCGINGKEIIE